MNQRRTSVAKVGSASAIPVRIFAGKGALTAPFQPTRSKDLQSEAASASMATLAAWLA
jgi:hypothetical protein